MNHAEPIDPIDAALRAIFADILGLGPDRAAALAPDDGLFGTLPELDSMAVATLLTEVEDRLGMVIDDEDVDADLFATYGSFLAFCRARATG